MVLGPSNNLSEISKKAQDPGAHESSELGLFEPVTVPPPLPGKLDPPMVAVEPELSVVVKGLPGSVIV